ncbi:hypothetical protein A2U01_0021141 [Trifolium medium]|uniref:Uncharacterized protein n=1 Tax=Trifolium medium TaxID=97028 RepID=A0A392NNR6_9FABA|nr:hypothetical protein [Trifolium medium]
MADNDMSKSKKEENVVSPSPPPRSEVFKRFKRFMRENVFDVWKVTLYQPRPINPAWFVE